MFTSVLIDSACEAVADALGKDVLGILASRGVLDNSDNPTEFQKQLSSIFGNGANVLERIIVKALYQRLRIPYDSTFDFDYAKALDVAKDVLFVETRLK